METAQPRPDLVEALLQSCWLVEAARASLLSKWGGEFAPDAERAGKRSAIVRDVLASRRIEAPDHVEAPHAAWVESLCGPTPTHVPLGAAVLQRLGDWTDAYIGPYVDDPDVFVALGKGDLRFPVPARHITDQELRLPSADPPPGRRFAIFTDIHAGAVGIEEQARHAVRDINAASPEFVVCPGDLTDDGEPEQFELVHDVLEGLDAPYHAVLGNHDAVRRSTRGAEGAELFEKAFGAPPDDVVLECGPLQVALIDSTDPTPSPFPDWDLARGGFRDDAGGVNNGALRPGQAEALAASLDPSRPALLVLHHELQPFPGFPPVMFGMRDEDSRALHEALRGHRIVGVIAGHTHRSAVLPMWDGSVTQLEVPALKDWPYTYTLLAVEDDRVHVTVHQLSDEALVRKRAQRVPPIYVGYVRGPLSALEHTFPL